MRRCFYLGILNQKLPDAYMDFSEHKMHKDLKNGDGKENNLTSHMSEQWPWNV